MSSKGRSHNVRETWRPTCRYTLEGIERIFKIRFDRCKRKQGHNGRCIGNYYVWNSQGITELRRKVKEAIGT